jgi:hypothetical protein
MIETPTVLILGAGASQPYGYPVGSDLKKIIINSLTNMADNNSGWVNELGFSIDLVKEFISKFNMSRRPSIDSFLAKQKEEFAEIGKIAIVDAIINSEDCQKLETPGEDDWYGYLVENLYEYDNIDEISENIKIISFNYDRSLETFLIRPLKGTYKELESVNDCAAIVKKIPIVHIYGRVDSLPWEDSGNGRAYGENCTSINLQKISKKINLVHEAKDLGTIGKANELINQSEKIYCLGLDLYRNRANIKLLNSLLFKDKELFTTVYGLQEGEIQQTKQFFFENFTKGYITGSTGFKSLQSIRYYRPF